MGTYLISYLMSELHRARRHLEIILNLLLLEDYNEACRQCEHLRGLEHITGVTETSRHLAAKNFGLAIDKIRLLIETNTLQ